MVATFILSILIFGTMGVIVYRQFFKKNGSKGCNCSDCHCGSPKKTVKSKKS